ncbi:MAG: GGDEF domain-containing protein [Actinobacteria bacterium]|nr:GGDEF domain-containing protein [Actinomycetota bacterium]
MYNSGLLGIGLVVAGLLAFLYAALRVRPGLSLSLQRRALSFLALAGIFLAAAQAPHALGALLWPGDIPGIYLVSWSLASGVLAASCVMLAAHFLRRSELNEVGPLRRSADIDPLTALHNQAFFRRAAARRITQAREYGLPLSLAMLDIDDFKEYNDAFGHEAGNAVLRILAGVLRRSVRADDLVARYGGEEFVVLLGGRAGEVHEAMERIRLQVEDRCSPVGDSPVRRQVTVSAGVAAFTEGIQTLEEFIEAADEAMYRAKRAGKNRVAVTEEEAA